MGQKVNPVGIRLGITRDWTSKWYAGTRSFPSHLFTDHLVRGLLQKKLVEASVSRITWGRGRAFAIAEALLSPDSRSGSGLACP